MLGVPGAVDRDHRIRNPSRLEAVYHEEII